ncbi:hypothetical protein [Alteromonas halophila]|nr:hypothetical protein [Alteromonas halophila]
MLRSRVLLLENANQLLLSFPALVKRMEVKDPQFLPSLFQWIEQAEQLLLEHRLPACAALSGIKARLLAPLHDHTTRSSRRKKQIQVACDNLFVIQSSLQEAVAAQRQNIEQASELLAQLFSLLAKSSADNGNGLHYRQNESVTAFAKRLWYLICHHEQLSGSAVQLRSLLSDSDIELLIAQQVDLEMFSPEA